MTDHEDFNQPGINLLDSWLVKELKNLDPRSLFAWSANPNGVQIIRYVNRADYIRLLIKKKQGK
jgi:hypothetical protein